MASSQWFYDSPSHFVPATPSIRANIANDGCRSSPFAEVPSFSPSPTTTHGEPVHLRLPLEVLVLPSPASVVNAPATRLSSGHTFRQQDDEAPNGLEIVLGERVLLTDCFFSHRHIAGERPPHKSEQVVPHTPRVAVPASPSTGLSPVTSGLRQVQPSADSSAARTPSPPRWLLNSPATPVLVRRPTTPVRQTTSAGPAVRAVIPVPPFTVSTSQPTVTSRNTLPRAPFPENAVEVVTGGHAATQHSWQECYPPRPPSLGHSPPFVQPVLERPNNIQINLFAGDDIFA